MKRSDGLRPALWRKLRPLLDDLIDAHLDWMDGGGGQDLTDTEAAVSDAIERVEMALRVLDGQGAQIGTRPAANPVEALRELRIR